VGGTSQAVAFALAAKQNGQSVYLIAPRSYLGDDIGAAIGLAGVQPGRDYHNSDHSFSDDTDVMDSTGFFVSSKLEFKDDFDCGELIDSRERRQIVANP